MRARPPVLAAGAAGLAAVVAVSVASTGGKSHQAPSTSATATVRADPAKRDTTPPPPAPAIRRGPPFAVGLLRLRLVDRSRRIGLPGRAPVPRTLVTEVRYPAAGTPVGGDRLGARAALAGGPYPLVVFGHGFRLTPDDYTRLLRAWARAGYVVAAPLFPLENAHAPGGPDESDLVNQPRDVSFVIARLLAASSRRGDPLSGLVDSRRIAVAGHSDGGETALAVAFDRQFRDPRVDAAVILSGARMPGTDALTSGPRSPALLATQGTADTVNPPSSTYDFYAHVGAPKYLLRLLGAAHEPPYTTGEPQLGIVERVTIAFLDRYLKGNAVPARRLAALGVVRGVSALSGRP